MNKFTRALTLGSAALFVSASAWASNPFTYAIDDSNTSMSSGVITAACPATFTCTDLINEAGTLQRRVTGTVEGTPMSFLQQIILDDGSIGDVTTADFSSETTVRQLGNATIANTANQVAALLKVNQAESSLGAGDDFAYRSERLEGGFQAGGTITTYTSPASALTSPKAIDSIHIGLGENMTQDFSFIGNGGGNGNSRITVSQIDSNVDNAAGDFAYYAYGGANGYGVTLAPAASTVLTTAGGSTATLSNPTTATNASGVLAVALSSGQSADQNLFGFQRFNAYNPIANTVGTGYTNLNASPTALASSLVNGLAGTANQVDTDTTANGPLGTTTGIALAPAYVTATSASITDDTVLWDANATSVFGALPF